MHVACFHLLVCAAFAFVANPNLPPFTWPHLLPFLLHMPLYHIVLYACSITLPALPSQHQQEEARARQAACALAHMQCWQHMLQHPWHFLENFGALGPWKPWGLLQAPGQDPGLARPVRRLRNRVEAGQATACLGLLGQLDPPLGRQSLLNNRRTGHCFPNITFDFSVSCMPCLHKLHPIHQAVSFFLQKAGQNRRTHTHTTTTYRRTSLHKPPLQCNSRRHFWKEGHNT